MPSLREAAEEFLAQKRIAVAGAPPRRSFEVEPLERKLLVEIKRLAESGGFIHELAI